MVKGVIGLETVPPPAPEAQMPRTKEDLLRTDSAHAVQNRDLMLANAMQVAGAFGADGPPEILTRDANHDGLVDPPSTSNRLQDELGPAVRDGLDRWGHRHAEPGSTGVVTTAPVGPIHRSRGFLNEPFGFQPFASGWPEDDIRPKAVTHRGGWLTFRSSRGRTGDTVRALPAP